MSEEEIDLDELERRLRSKWLDGAAPPSALADGDKAMAEKLLGKDNTRRLAKTPRGKTFHYVAPVFSAEYFYSPPYGEYITMGGGWTINIFENGKKRTTTPGLEEDRCMFIIKQLTKRGIPVRKFETEAMRRERERTLATPSPTVRRETTSRRRQMLEQLKGFRA